GEVHVVPGARDEVLVVADALPGGAVVVGAVQAALLGVLDQRPHAPGLGGGGGHADLAERALRQAGAAGDVLPGLAAVGGHPQAAVGAAARDLPEGAVGLPDRGVHDARVGVQRQVDRAGLGALVEHLAPGLAAVDRLEDAALLVRPEGMPERRDVDDVRVLGVDAHLGDVAGVGQAHVPPGAPAVGGLVHAVAVRHVDAD